MRSSKLVSIILYALPRKSGIETDADGRAANEIAAIEAEENEIDIRERISGLETSPSRGLW